MASSLSLSWLSIQWSLGDPYDVSLFAVCLLGSDELWVYDQIYVFIHESYLSLLWSLICMTDYSLIFLLRYLGFVWPTWSIYLAMGRGALWWVRSCGAQSQWQKETWHAYIVSIKDKTMGSIPTWIDLVYIMSSFLRHYSISPWTQYTRCMVDSGRCVE